MTACRLRLHVADVTQRHPGPPKPRGRQQEGSIEPNPRHTHDQRPIGRAIQANFRRVWAAQTVSLLGSEVTALALPLTAALALHATPWQMGLLSAAARVPFLLLSLPAGVWIDRTARRPWMLGSDVGRALLLLSVPIAAALHHLTLGHLYVVALGVGALNVLFDLAYIAFMPTLVPREQLLTSNSRLQLSASVATTAGPGLGGALVQWLTAPFALLFDALSFLASAWLLWGVRQREPTPTQATQRGVLHAVREGLSALLGHPLLRPIILTSTGAYLVAGAITAEYVLYATRELHLNAATIALIYTVGGAGALPGAWLTNWAARRFGVGRAILGGWLVWGVAGLAVPLAGGPVALAIAILAVGQAVGSLADTVVNVQQWSLRQVVTPDHLQARVTAGHRFFVRSGDALGAVLGGALASTVGLRPMMWLCAVAVLVAVLPAWATSLRHLRRMPASAATATDEHQQSIP